MPDQYFYDKVNGWMAAAVAGALNLLLITWVRIMGSKAKRLESRMKSVEENKASETAFAAHVARSEKQVSALFSKVDDIHESIDKTRRELKGDMNMIAGLIQNGSKE